MKRKAIRAAAVTLLDGLTGYSASDDIGRTVNKDQVPRIDVRWGAEERLDQEQQTLDGLGLYLANLELGISNRGDGLPDFIDDSIYEIRNLFRSNRQVGGAVDCRYESADAPEIVSTGDKPITTFTIQVQVIYAE